MCITMSIALHSAIHARLRYRARCVSISLALARCVALSNCNARYLSGANARYTSHYKDKASYIMPVITVGSSKGGCGKTTTVLALASEIRSAGSEVCIIDADDQLSAYNWYQKWQAKDRITVIDASSLNRDIDIRGHIKDAAAQYPFVIVDPAGMRSQRMQWAASLSDMWIIPQKATSLDAAATANLLDIDMEAIVGMRGGRPYPIASSSR